MSSLDSQFMCLGTMFTNDIVVRYKEKLGLGEITDRGKVFFARAFVLLIVGIVFLIDLVEQLRKFDTPAVGMLEGTELALLNIPSSLYRMLPLLITLTTITLFLSLSRTSEMVVTRASGRSAIRSLVAPTLTAFMIGVLGVMAINPIVALQAKASDNADTVITGSLSVGVKRVMPRTTPTETTNPMSPPNAAITTLSMRI